MSVIPAKAGRSPTLKRGVDQMKISVLSAVCSLALSGCSMVPGTSSNKIEQTVEYVRGRLNDPESAVFRSLKFAPKSHTKTVDSVCGEFNARNRLGGMVGFTRFIANAETDWATIDPRQNVVRLSYQMAEEKAFCERLGTESCRRFNEFEDDLRAQTAFDFAWDRSCKM